MKMISFWKVSDEYGFMSNWYRIRFYMNIPEIGLVQFNSSEQAFMYQKAILFKDFNIANCILSTNNQSEIKALGRQVHNFDQKIWDEQKVKLMYNAVYAKFYYNSEIKDKLLLTADATLVEASPLDSIWGIGMSADEDISNQENWKGKNLLGQVLMQVREDLIDGIEEEIGAIN